MGKIDKDIPCYGCTRRWATNKDSCHSSCEEYKEFKQKREDQSRVICKKKADEAMCTEVRIRSIQKTIKDKTARKQSIWKG